MGSESIFAQIMDFIIELLRSLGDGALFFGSKKDFFLFGIDILLVFFLFYFVLKFITQSRAWQLIKGILLIVFLVILADLFGLETLSFLFKSISTILATLVIVIFQPELRRGLETVGLSTMSSLKGFITTPESESHIQLSSVIHEISLACKEMSASYTGALILIERKTKLNELLSQENVVKFDSTVTNSVLQSVFYKGSPMHDGGLLIRDGRIIAARCHVPLSVTMRSLSRSGTRHRAAVGASEMGDTIAVVVSEERGKTSIAVNGSLYEMADASELEANLSYLLGVTGEVESGNRLGKIIKKIRKKNRKIKATQQTVEVDCPTDAVVTAANGEVASGIVVKSGAEKSNGNGKRSGNLSSDRSLNHGRKKISVASNAGLIIMSLVLSCFMWLYVQIKTNPVITRTFEVPITYNSESMPEGTQISFPISTVEVRLKGRQNTLDKLTANDIIATLEYSQITGTTAYENVPVIVMPADRGVYFRVEQQLPETVYVMVNSTDTTGEESE